MIFVNGSVYEDKGYGWLGQGDDYEVLSTYLRRNENKAQKHKCGEYDIEIYPELIVYEDGGNIHIWSKTRLKESPIGGSCPELML